MNSEFTNQFYKACGLASLAFPPLMEGSKIPLTITSCPVRHGSLTTLGLMLDFSEYGTSPASRLRRSLPRCLTRPTRQRCSERKVLKCFLQDFLWQYLRRTGGKACASRKLPAGADRSGQRGGAQRTATAESPWLSPQGSNSDSVPILRQL